MGRPAIAPSVLPKTAYVVSHRILYILLSFSFGSKNVFSFVLISLQTFYHSIAYAVLIFMDFYRFLLLFWAFVHCYQTDYKKFSAYTSSCRDLLHVPICGLFQKNFYRLLRRMHVLQCSRWNILWIVY